MSCQIITFVASQDKIIFEKLKEIALKDNKMTTDETMIISEAMAKAKAFHTALTKANEDGVISKSERKTLESLRARIYKSAYKMASKDDIVSQEEVALLSKLVEIVRDMKTYE